MSLRVFKENFYKFLVLIELLRIESSFSLFKPLSVEKDYGSSMNKILHFVKLRIGYFNNVTLNRSSNRHLFPVTRYIGTTNESDITYIIR